MTYMTNSEYLFEDYATNDNSLIKEGFNNIPKARFKEWLTLGALQSSDAVSPFTRDKFRIRMMYYKPENIEAKLLTCEYDVAHDTMTFHWLTTATMKIYPKDHKCVETDPLRDFKLIPNPSNAYTMSIRVLDFVKWLKDTRPQNMQGQKITWKEIKEVMDIAYVQIFCSCPSFQYQVANWSCSQLDASIYPTDIEPKVWNKIHGTDSFLCKHMEGLMKSMAFFLNPMASMAQKKLKELGII